MEAQSNNDISPDVIPAPKWDEIIKPNPHTANYGTGFAPIGQDWQSPNYKANETGWKLGSNGNAEFQDALIRGTIIIGGQYRTVAVGDDIQDAIDAVNTAGGGVVVLQNGTHTLADDITLYPNTYLQGQNGESSIIDFNSTAKQIKIVGSGAYSTGTITIANNGTGVVGSSTAWATNATAGQLILLGGLWYPITVVTDDTHITIAVPYGGAGLSGASYTLATTKNDVKITDLTIKNSATAAIKAQYAFEVFLQDLNFSGNASALDFDQASQATFRLSDMVACNSGADLNDCHFLEWSATGTLDMLAGNGVTLTGVTNSAFNDIFLLNSSADGLSLTNCSNLKINGVSSENGGQGVELVSGNTDIFFVQFGAQNNASDGIKLTATSDNIFMTSCTVKGNGGYGVSLAASTDDNNVITGCVFASNSSGAVNDSGTGTVIRGNVGVADNATGNLASASFGGDGSDGALSVSANTDINASSANYVVKQYTSITIDATKVLGLTNPADGGTVLHLKSQGDVTINGSISLSGDGALGGTAGPSTGDASGAGSNADFRWEASNNQYGGAVGTSVGAGGGGGGGAQQNSGSAGATGGGGGSAGGSGGVAIALFDSYVNPNIFKSIRALCGAGGGGGGGGQDNAGGAGGRGGGAVIIECKGNLTFGASSTIDCSGADGAAGGGASSSGGGGGGGGGGGQIIILYNGTLTNGGLTTDITGGAGGAGGNASVEDGGAGGAGGNGDYFIAENQAFA